MATLNDTHDPARRSWVRSANHPDTDFPIQNLPFGVFRRRSGAPRGGVAIGEQIVDLAAALEAGLFVPEVAETARAAAGPTLNPLMALGNGPASALRAALSDLLRSDGPARGRAEPVLVPMAEAGMETPTAIGDFTDFLCSHDHTMRMSPTGKAPPAFASMPLAYHSRASSVRVSGAPVVRPNGQFRAPDETIRFGPEPALDFELELGAFIGPGNALGRPIGIEGARQHLFGYCLLNDWSARSMQAWEMVPLGPFLAKSLLTSISPWVVTAEAMAPFGAPAHTRQTGDEAPPHLSCPEDQAEGGMDIAMEARLLTSNMRQTDEPPARITRTSFLNCTWTFAQMVTHHASNGCNLQPGDLIGSGTMSGSSDEARACMAELTARGSEPLTLPGNERRSWLEDGDDVVFHATAERDGFVPIGFGECRGRIEPALSYTKER